MVSRKRLAIVLFLIAICAIYGQSPDSLGIADDTSYIEPEQILPETANSLIDSLKKEDVISYIDKLRGTEYPPAISLDRSGFSPFLSSYNSDFHFTGLINNPIQLNKNNFSIPNTPHSPWFYAGYLGQFHALNYDGYELIARLEPYTLPVSLSRLQASLGDYDSRYALGSFTKGYLFNIEGLSLQADYNLLNGWWADSPNSGSSARSYLRYEKSDYIWDMELAGYNKESGSYELNTAYWHLGNFSLKNKYSQILASFHNPWLNLSFAHVKDRDSSFGYLKSMNMESLQIAADKSLSLGRASLGLRHEYQDLKRDYRPASLPNQSDYKHKSSLTFFSGYLANLNLDLDVYDAESAEIMARLEKPLGRFALGINSRYRLGDYDPQTLITSPIDGSDMPAVDILYPSLNSIYAGLSLDDLQLHVAFSTKQIEQHQLASKYASKPDLISIWASYEKRFMDFSVNIDSDWNYQEYDPYLMAAPKFSFQSKQSLSWHLSHDNLLSGGFSVYGHSDYYLANTQTPVLIEASTILDAFASVRISKMFDFTISARNLLSTSLFGLYPVPLSLHAGLRWYFIN